MPDDRPVVVLITVDPRASHRANEAMRIGLGIAAGENQVVLVLSGPAIHLLDEDTDALVDGDDVAKFRANLKALAIPFHIDAPLLPTEADWNTESHPVVAVDRSGLADLVRQARRLLTF
jgi:hypothetical protein